MNDDKPKEGGGDVMLTSLRLRTSDASERCAEKLRRLLADAEAGMLRDVLVVAFRQDDGVTLHWTPQTDQNGFAFVGALHAMANKLVERMGVDDLGDKP